MSDSQSQSDTELYSYTSLNKARITSPSEVNSTPSTRNGSRKNNMKHIHWDHDSDEEDEVWRLLLTRSIEQAAEKTPQKAQVTQSMKKHLQKTAQITNKEGCKFESMCPICLNKYNEVRGSLPCQHEFCFDCITEWCKTSTICPCCRGSFKHILKLVSGEKGVIKQTERVEVEAKELVLTSEYDYYTCYQCGLGDNEHVLLICDGCDFYCCHVYCDADLHCTVPEGDWYCIYCRENPRYQHRELEQAVESEEESPEKVIAQRTRSRRSFNMRGRLSALRSLRRRR